MADKDAEKKETEADEKKTIEIDPAVVKQGVALIKKQGYITRKDIPEIQQDDWARALSEKISAAFHDADEAPYIYYERYDFADHEITGIIFNMDQIKTRAEAGNKLGQALGLKSFEH
ncbi:hypothetical protein [Loigolactobacillus rennini]|uniref:Uncharacterized protein n=2 Tax=Loigolactobacillus rennini TaxID=238013 RepID=A0A0R2D2S4_9LACO|nr:hypothetical protein [Loigolactobacillus rennini]KRM94841.1 hypothetical protein FC24_GL000106 [Loigolactobacillus rennini DSM 20253]SFZ87303.1 hypothetical protein LREN565_0416 [Loigolactobacillus rennini]